ncbi:hypothetical protein Leryth_008428 [Lithospermum erythrorhizon]|nr:hypothetical protein Leryth_008428 [Lithospermum erythrorhizon]
MRKHWLYWIGGGSSKSAKRGRFTNEGSETPPPPPAPPSGCMCLQIFDLNHFHFPLVHQQQLSSKPDDDSGLLQDDDIDHEPTIKGVEAPRNSLELEETMSSYEGATSSASSTMKEANLNIPVGIQIRTSCESKSPRESTSECSSSSPGTKTPGVVARLMGLDLLPEDGSPSSSRFSTPTTSMKSRLQHHYSAGNRDKEDRARNLLKNKSKNGTRSLPETPRGSSSSDRRSDVEQCRHSLQIINKEGSNNGEDDQFDLASYIAKRVIARRKEDLARTSIQEDESSSQRRHYAKQIVKQMKESVTRRKFGHDITNSVTNIGEQNVVLLKPNNKKSLREVDQSSSSTSKQSTPSCSPRLRFLEIKNHHKPPPFPILLSTESQTSHQRQYAPMPKHDKGGSDSKQPKISLANRSLEEMKTPQEIRPEVQLLQQSQSPLQPKAIHVSEKVASERYKLNLKKSPPTSVAAIIRTKKEEPFIRSPSKNKDKNLRKFTLSTELLSNNVPTILHVKKDPPNSPSTTSFHKQSREVSNAQSSRKSKQQLHKSLSQSYYSTCSVKVQENVQGRCKNGAKMSSDNGEIDIEKGGYDYFQYIQRILKRTCIHSSTPISLAKWYTPSHPLDPAIFHYMELFHHPKNSKLNQRCTRKLIFHLADELLAQILKPYINFKPWVDKFPRICPQMNGNELTEQICSRIDSFPSANCQVLEDIDALIDKDFHASSSSQIEVAYEAEGEGIVTEIERYIMESMVHEMAVEVVLQGTSRR